MNALHAWMVSAGLTLASCGTLHDAPIRAIGDGVVVDGEVARPRTFRAADLEALGADDVVVANEHGGTHSYRGVELGRVLTAVGFDPGPKGRDVPMADKRSGWKRIVIATASDDYQTVFSCAEVAEHMGATRALLVFARDGRPLSSDEGPIRIVVPTDGEGSRSIRCLARIHIVDARRALAEPESTIE